MNELEIQALGMSRSGNHAVANWIFAQADAPKLLLNCAEGKTNPFETCRPLSTGGFGWRGEPDFDVEAEAAGRFADKALLFHSYEDSWLAHAFSKPLEENHDTWLGPSKRRVRLLILRDPFNLFASRLKMGAALSPHISRRMWKQHAREALGETRKVRDKVVVLYNRWAVDRDYRKDVAGQLGLRFTDAGADEVPRTQGGSSFDGTAFDGRAAEMRTRERWRAYENDARYRAIFDDEMVDLSARLFGPPPAFAVPKPEAGDGAEATPA